MDSRVRIEKRVLVGGLVERVVSIEVPEDADEWQVANAVAKIEDVGDKLERLSGCCKVPVGAVHRSSCIYARDREDWIDGLRESAIREGMAP